MLHKLAAAAVPRWLAVRQASTVYSAALIERRPVILPDPHPAEERFWELQDQIHQIKATPFPDEILSTAVREQERLEEDRSKGTQAFVPAPRRTAADAAKDTRSLDRALDQTLYLMLREGSEWQFPVEPVRDDSEDALHLAAQRAAEGQACTVDLIARSPVAHCSSDDGHGVFYHLAQLLPSNKSAYDIRALEELRGDNFGWFTKAEVLEHCAARSDLTKVLETVLVD